MLNKYIFITIMEGEFCKIIIYKICVQKNLLFLWNKIRINSPLDWFWSIYNLQMLFSFQQHASWLSSVISLTDVLNFSFAQSVRERFEIGALAWYMIISLLWAFVNWPPILTDYLQHKKKMKPICAKLNKDSSPPLLNLTYVLALTP